jgi:hypothetical protein
MTKTLQTLVCALALIGAVHMVASADGGGSVLLTSTRTAANTPASTSTETAGTELKVKRLLVATGVSEREPLGAASSFSIASTSRLVAFLEIDNPAAQATTLEVTWIDTATGTEHRPYSLQIQAHKRWRTWARAAAPKKPGEWALVVRDQSGDELARTPFTMTE